MESTGVWIKYKKGSRMNYSSNSSYVRLFNDLKGSSAMWHIACSLDSCRRELCGDEISFGARPGDIYVFYVNDELGNRTPKIFFKTLTSPSGVVTVTDVCGANLVLDENEKLNNYNFNVEPYYLGELIKMLKEIGADEELISKYESRMRSFVDLYDLFVRGIQTDEDVIFLYENFTREDTSLARELMAGRCVQDDYERLNDKNKEKFFRVICKLNHTYSVSKVSPTERINEITVIKNRNGKILDIDDRELIIRFASESGLKSLYYASDELRRDRDFVLSVLENFTIGLEPLYERNLPEEFTTDIEVLSRMTSSKPYRLREVIESYLRNGNEELKAKLNDINFVSRLLKTYYNVLLKDGSLCGSEIVDCSILWHFSTEVLNSLDDSILYGPEPSPLREDYRRRICEEQSNTASKIITMRMRKTGDK